MNNKQPNDNEVKIEMIRSIKEFALEALRLFMTKANKEEK